MSARRVRTLVYGVFVAFAAAFVVLSIQNLVEQVFGFTAVPVSTALPAGRACADGIRALTRALDRGVAASAEGRDEAEALEKMRGALAPEWDHEGATAATCTADPHGTEAWAALLRLRRAEEGAAGRRAAFVAPVRRGVEAYLSP